MLYEKLKIFYNCEQIKFMQVLNFIALYGKYIPTSNLTWMLE